MNMNMNEKGRQTRLLAAIAVLAMVVCALAVAMPAEDVSALSPADEPAKDVVVWGTGTTAADNGRYYVANGTGATDAEIELPDSGTITIYAQSGAGIAFTGSAGTITINMYIAAGEWTQTTAASGGNPAKGSVPYYDDTLVTFTSIASKNFNVTAGNYGFTATGTAATDYTAPTGTVVLAGTTGVTYYNTNVVGVEGGVNSFELLAGESLTIPASTEFTKTVTVSNDTNPAGTDFTAANSIQFIPETTGTGEAATTKFIASAVITVTDTAGAMSINGNWSQGAMDVTKGKVTVDTTTITGNIRDTVGNGTGNGSTLCSDLATANTNQIGYYVFFPGTYSGNITYNGINGAIYVNAGASYNGTVSVSWTADVSSSVQPTPSGTTVNATYTQTVTMNVDNTNGTGTTNVATVTNNAAPSFAGTAGTSGGIMSSSNVTITDVSSSYTLTDSNGAAYAGTIAEAPISVSGVAFGNIELEDKVVLAGDAMTLTGTRLTFLQGGEISFTNDEDLILMGELYSSVDKPNQQITGSTTGYIYTTNVNDVKTYYAATGLVDQIRALAKTYNLSDGNDIAADIAELPAGTSVTINASGTANQNVIPISGDITFDGLVITLAGNHPITFQVSADGSFNLKNTTIDDITIGTADSKIIALPDSAIAIQNSRLYLVVDVAEGASESISNEGVIYENTSSDVKVGYGTTLTLKDSTNVNTIDIYGTLVVSGNVTIPALEEFDAHDNSTIIVDGVLTILGTATFQAGSETTINGTFNVGQSNQGGAIVNIEGDFTVAENGTMTVNPGVTGNVYSFNTLNAPDFEYDADGYGYKFSVYGNLNMSGQMSGTVHDLGTISFNGSAVRNTSVTVVVYQDVTLNIGSFNGTINVTDAGICDDIIDGNPNMSSSTGNMVSFVNVTGATVSVSVDRFDYTVGDVNKRDYRSVMSVYGTLGAVAGTAGNGMSLIDTSDLTYKAGVGAKGDQVAYVVVPEGQTLTFGTNVSWDIDDSITVDGTVNFVKAANISDVKNITGSRTSGELTVNGTVTISGQVNLPETIVSVNAVKYSVSDTATGIITYTYTNFANAIDAAANAQLRTAYVYGDVTVSADDEVAVNDIVSLDATAVLTIGEGVTLTISDGGKINGSTDGAIVVDGTMVANDYANDVFITDISADVVKTEGAVRTWTSLYNAINELNWTDITLSGAVVIDEDLTIPAGTTVTTNVAPVTDSDGTYSVLVKGATLTVEGTLQMQSASRGALVVTDVNNAKGDIVVTGTVIRTVQTSVLEAQGFNDFKTGDHAIDGVYFTLREGAYRSLYITNMANAGTIVSATTQLVIDENDIGVEVCGSVGAQDASFAVAENATAYTISVNGGSNLSMGTLTLNGVGFTVGSAANTLFTGSVSAPIADGESNAVIDMDRVSNISVLSYSIMGVNTTYGVGIHSAAGYAGSVSVSQGTIGIGNNTNPGLAVSNGASLTIASGATLDIAAGRTLTINDADGVVIDGTISIANASGLATGVTSGHVVLTVNGTMDVDAALNTGVYLNVAGDLNVLDDNVMTVSAPVVIGTAPATLGVGGTLTGSYVISSGSYILAYAGADLSGARINWNAALSQSDAQSTVYHVNDTEYATVYANGGVGINGIFGYVGDSDRTWTEINLSGWDNLSADFVGTTYAYQWYTADGLKATGNIGSADAVYIEFDLAQIKGTISKDAGIILTIDDLVIGSNGDVSQTVRDYGLTVGTHTISWSERTGYNIENVTVTFNGVAVENGGTITVTADMTGYTIVAQGAVPGAAPGGSSTGDDGLGLTDYLLIILVVLIVVMAVMVALRLMRS